MMIDSKALAKAGCKYISTPYSKIDCQKLWEKMLADCGLSMDLGGSNSWYRYIMQHGWCGTPEDCKKKYGCIPAGATLFIREDVSESTPAQFRDDGIGDITHIGVYTAMTGAEMCDLAIEAGVVDADRYNYGNGAIHSSSSRGGVCTSKFEGETIPNGGWNRVGLFLEKVSYPGIDQGDDPEHDEPEYAIVIAENGSTVKMRAKPTQDCGLYWDVPIGSEVIVDGWDVSTDKKGQKWSRITWAGQDGYMISKFLQPEDYSPPAEIWLFVIPCSSKEQAEELLTQYPNGHIEKGVG